MDNILHIPNLNNTVITNDNQNSLSFDYPSRASACIAPLPSVSEIFRAKFDSSSKSPDKTFRLNIKPSVIPASVPPNNLKISFVNNNSYVNPIQTPSSSNISDPVLTTNEKFFNDSFLKLHQTTSTKLSLLKINNFQRKLFIVERS